MSNFTEEKVYEAFGLEVPEKTDAGEKGQEIAEPAQTEQTGSNEGEKGQEVAEPAQTDSGTDAGADVEDAKGDDPDEEKAGTSTEKQPQTAQQRRENAARRRAQEQQAAIDQAVAAALQAEREKNDAAMQEFFAKAGLKNLATGEAITNMDGFQKWQEELQAQRLEQQLKSGKLTPEILNEVVSNHPAVKQAEAMIEQNAIRQQQEQEAQARARIEAEIAEIGKLDPSIKSVADLLNMPNAKEFRELVNRGYSFKDAHYVLNRDKIEQARTEAAKQQTLNNVQSKDHLKAAGGNRGTGAVAVPEADMKWFRAFNPNASDAEIQAFYNKHK